jgi:hypothetical protein
MPINRSFRNQQYIDSGVYQNTLAAAPLLHTIPMRALHRWLHQRFSGSIKEIFPHFESDMDWQFLAPEIMCKMSEMIDRKRGQMYFFQAAAVSKQ